MELGIPEAAFALVVIAWAFIYGRAARMGRLADIRARRLARRKA